MQNARRRRKCRLRVPVPAYSQLSNPAAIRSGFWLAIVAEESAACSAGGAASPTFMQGFADAFRSGGGEDFPLPHFRAMPGIFPEAPAHLMDALGDAQGPTVDDARDCGSNFPETGAIRPGSVRAGLTVYPSDV